MNKHMNLQKTITATQEKFNIGSIVNQALVDILIDNQIISEEELVNSIKKATITKVDVVNVHS